MRKDVRDDLLPFAERLTTAVEAAGGKKAVAEGVPIAISNLDRYMNAQAEPPVRAAAKLASYLKTDLNYLVSGFGEPGYGRSTPESGDLVQIPIIEPVASAGPGAANEHERTVGQYPFPRSTLTQLGIPVEAVVAARSDGDSMLPTIADGALVLINTRERELKRDGVYMFVHDGALRIKRVQPIFSGAILLKSDNDELYKEEIVARENLNSLHIVGRAFWSEKLL